MTSYECAERSYARIETHHLRKLADLAMSDLTDLFAGCPQVGDRYRNRLMLLCLCQGAARHFVHGDRGVKDFDVWAFFAVHPEGPFPYRRRGKQDFGRSRFGASPNDEGYEGRRVDVLGRSIPCFDGREHVDCVRDWLMCGTKSSREVAKSPVVVIHPPADIGSIIWNPECAR